MNRDKGIGPASVIARTSRAGKLLMALQLTAAVPANGSTRTRRRADVATR